MAKKKDEAPTIGDLLKEVSETELEGGETQADGALEVSNHRIPKIDAFKERVFFRVLETHIQVHLEKRSGDKIERVIESMLEDSEYIADMVSERAYNFLTREKAPPAAETPKEEKKEEGKAPVVISSM